MRTRLVFTSVGLLALLAIDACIRVVRSSVSLEGFRWSAVLMGVAWIALAVGQWRTRGGWRIPIMGTSAVWLVIGLATFYVSMRMKPQGWSVAFSPALHSWIVAIVVPAAVISVNLRLRATQDE